MSRRTNSSQLCTEKKSQLIDLCPDAKKRLQVSGWGVGRVGLGETAKYTGLRQCVASLIAQEGLRGLYKVGILETEPMYNSRLFLGSDHLIFNKFFHFLRDSRLP